MFKNNFFIILLLIFINIIAHFFPLERASLGHDDYVFLAQSQKIKISGILSQTLKISDRPINYAISMLQGKLIGNRPGIAFLFLILSSSFISLSIFWLLNCLFNNILMAFVGSVIFCLLPNKLETFQNSVFLNLNIAITICILSLVFFLYFVKTQRMIYLVTSLCTYTISIFWYPVGFFIPILIAVYSFLYKKRFVKYTLYFLVIAVVYTTYRFTNVFGLTNSVFDGKKIDLSIMPIIPMVDLFHHYFGRYMARNIVYGFYKFLSIEQPWLAIIIFSDIILLIIIALFVKRKNLERIDNRSLIFSAFLLIVFLMPFFLNKQYGIASRYLTLPSIAVSIFAIWLLERTNRLWRIIFFSFMALTLIICQGNAWTQVIASRINSAIYQTMEGMKNKLVTANNVVFDVRSLADNIPFTLVKRDYNVFDTYYGTQVFHSASQESMLNLILGDDQKSVYISTESPKVIGDRISLAISEKTGYRSVFKKSIILPKKGTVIIDFKSTYPEGFNNGIRRIK